MTDSDIVAVFARCFRRSYATQLVGGAAEPLYQPSAAEHEPHRLFYRENFAASALHETAHWCLAGSARRKLVDFGYVYIEPPRTPAAQTAFFTAELKVQGLEELFCAAAGLEFVPSADQIGVDLNDFRQLLAEHRSQVRHWMQNSPDQRAHQFEQALHRACSPRRSAVA